MKPMYLVMVTASANNNKFYRMLPQGDQFLVEYGRIGNDSFQTATYPISQWGKKLNEKLRKGYQDKTELIGDLVVEVKNSGDSHYRPIANKVIAEIIDRLQSMARMAVEKNYTVKSTQVTQAMVDEAQNQLNHLLKVKDLEDFNNQLLELFAVIPRKMKKVGEYLAQTTQDFAKIIQAESDLLDVMRGQVVQHSASDGALAPSGVSAEQKDLLQELGLEFYEVNDQDISQIKKALGADSHRFIRAWGVRNIKTTKAFDVFTKAEKIKEAGKKLLWHGSRNENWWSIINSGLVLRPTNAVITGKMFGYGLYFATKAAKSIGYTSLHGSYWARGSANTAFMGLYEVAYGTPYDVYSFESRLSSFDYQKLQAAKAGANCLHAHAGSMLRNDEIVVYKEAQTAIKYLVEIQ